MRSTRYWAWAVAAGTGPLVQAAALAQPVEDGAQPVREVDLGGQVELPRLVDLAAQRLAITIDYDAAVVSGRVTLRPGAGLSDGELWSLLNRTLAARGLTTVRTGDRVYTVAKLAEAAGMARPDDTFAGPEPGFRAATVAPRNQSAKDAAEAVAKILSKPGGTVAQAGDALFIADLSPRVEQALALVARLDAAGPRTVVREVPVDNLSPIAMAALVAQVAAKRALVAAPGDRLAGEVVPSPNGRTVLLVAPEDLIGAWTALIADLDRREGIQTVSYGPRAFPPADVARLIEQTAKNLGPEDDRWRVVVDDLTGTVIITATPSQHEAIKGLVDRLDATPVAARRPVRSFVLKNRSVRELLPILEQLTAAGVVSAQGASGSPQPPDLTDVGAPRQPPETRVAPSPPGSVPAGTQSTTADPGASTPTHAPAHASPGSVTLTADEATNTIIAMGEARVLDQLAALISQLDVRQPQVMLDVLLVSLNDTQTLDLGVELDKIEINLGGDTTARIASLFGLVPRPGGVPTVAGQGLTGIVLNPGDFSVVLRALQTIRHGRSLSMPRVLVTNNQQATLDSILEQPFASTNASDTVATTSFGGTLPAGTQISIRPQIAEGDHLTLEYQVSLSAFTGAASDPALPPPRQQNKVQSVATIPDGYTVVVGGIDLDTEARNVSQVPLLAQIPIIGEAFKNRSRNESRTRFFVFIRASVMWARGFEDLKYASGRSALEAGVDDGWPQLEPRVIR